MYWNDYNLQSVESVKQRGEKFTQVSLTSPTKDQSTTEFITATTENQL